MLWLGGKGAGMRKFFFLILFLALSLLSPQVFSQEITSTSITTIDYELPYPGLMPDNPLYFLKVGRDLVVGMLISDSLKKAEFDLLAADKRLNAGVYILNSAKQNEKKINMAESTISKGENYFEKAIGKAREAKMQGMDIKDISARLLTSSKKHQEVIKELKFESLLKRAQGFEKQVKSLMSK